MAQKQNQKRCVISDSCLKALNKLRNHKRSKRRFLLLCLIKSILQQPALYQILNVHFYSIIWLITTRHQKIPSNGQKWRQPSEPGRGGNTRKCWSNRIKVCIPIISPLINHRSFDCPESMAWLTQRLTEYLDNHQTRQKKRVHNALEDHSLNNTPTVVNDYDLQETVYKRYMWTINVFRINSNQLVMIRMKVIMPVWRIH